jgi:hypothetical protein
MNGSGNAQCVSIERVVDRLTAFLSREWSRHGGGKKKKNNQLAVSESE